jgi:NAD(P)-dependent dehydrogenase (short-subunit alcohol dehydrogenase family)
MSFAGKHILVTGASSGIGRAAALQLARQGACISAVARREDLLVELVNELSHINSLDHSFFTCDLSSETEINELSRLLQPVDGILHAAGKVFPLPVKFIREKHLLEVMKINFFAPVILNATLLGQQKIKDCASVVFISSISTKHPYFGGSLYVSSKAALESYSRNFALEVASRKIRSNVVSPALVKTAIFDLTVESYDAEQLKAYENKYPFGFGEPEDVANTVVFLLSDLSKWITGQEIVMDGGLTLQSV